jgi:hypothetical protein
VFYIGSAIVVKSASQEFAGELTIISPSELVVRLDSGTRIRLLVTHLRQRFVEIFPDVEHSQNMALINEASIILSQSTASLM